MRILTVTNMYPTKRNPQFGIFVQEQVRSIRALGHDVDVLFINGREGRVRHKGYFIGPARLWSQLRRQSYDVIHAHYVYSGVIARMQWATPVVLTHHGPELRDPVQGRLCRRTRSWFNQLIVVADWMVPELGGRPPHVIPCGVDLDLFKPADRQEARTSLGLDPDKRYVLFAGNTWDKRKRFDLVEAAVARLTARHDDIELVTICGRPHDLIPRYMQACDVFAMTSITEGSAQVVKEAMACNLPIVATDAGDNWNVLGDTEGCYRTGADPVDIARQLESALSPPRRTDGRARVEHFGLEATARAVLDVYAHAAAHTSVPAANTVRATR